MRNHKKAKKRKFLVFRYLEVFVQQFGNQKGTKSSAVANIGQLFFQLISSSYQHSTAAVQYLYLLLSTSVYLTPNHCYLYTTFFPLLFCSDDRTLLVMAFLGISTHKPHSL